MRSRARWPACVRCKRPRGEGELLSWRGLCLDCSVAAVRASHEAMRTRRGPMWRRWVASMTAAGQADRIPKRGAGRQGGAPRDTRG